MRADQRERLEREGFVHVPGVVPESVLKAVEKEYSEILSKLIDELVEPGTAVEIHKLGSFSDRFIALASVVERPIMPYFEISYGFVDLSETTPISLGNAIFELLTCPEVLDVVEDIIGPEISVNPVQHTRIKLPSSGSDSVQRNGNNASRTEWHQDVAAFSPDADRTNAITVWVPITDATEDNGCLVYLPGSHRWGLALHCPPSNMSSGSASNIPKEYIPVDDAIPAPARRGDVLMHPMLTKHASLDNTTSAIRWSFDLRYQPTGEPTGRSIFPTFVVRSRSNPASVLRDPAVWRAEWVKARDNLRALNRAPESWYRWTTGSAWC